MPKCNFNKAALQIYWNRTSAWVFSCKFAAHFQNTFSQEHFWRAASVEFQLDKPLVPLIYVYLKLLIRNPLQIFGTVEELEKCKIATQMATLNLTNHQIFIQPKKCNMWFHVQEILQTFAQKDIVISTQVNKFKNDAEAIIINILKKLFECTPFHQSLLGPQQSLFQTYLFLWKGKLFPNGSSHN